MHSNRGGFKCIHRHQMTFMRCAQAVVKGMEANKTLVNPLGSTVMGGGRSGRENPHFQTPSPQHIRVRVANQMKLVTKRVPQTGLKPQTG